MQCRASVTCTQLSAPDAGTCAPNQLCTQAAGQDAVCVPGQCQPNFKFDTGASTCVACVSPNCANEPTCAGDAGPGCEALNRVCDQNGAVAVCGACKSGFTANGLNVCIPAPRCGNTTCAINQFCDTSTGNPVCAALLCPAGQAKAGPTGACTACTTPANCNAPGYSGRYWQFQSAPAGIPDGQCVCETIDGFFQPAGGTGLAERCDADNDGWVRKEADDNTIRENPALRANARCTIRTVDRVKLVDETGVTGEVHSCVNSLDLTVPRERLVDGGLAPLVDGGFAPVPGSGVSACGAAANIVPIRLLETERNDIPGRATATTRAPEYGGSAGRLLVAKELNTLTKGCVKGAAPADYNDNQVDDILEVQGKAAPADDQARLAQFSYFVELYTAYYEPSAGVHGALVIQERARCDATTFPLRYDPAFTTGADGGSPSDAFSFGIDAGSTYWRSCERRRDPGYSSSAMVGALGAGNDFAQWSCPSTTGTCPFQGPPSATQVAPTNPATTFFRDFGRCGLSGQLPRDQRWRGFGHHSQFKCVNVTTTAPGGINVPPASFGAGREQYVFNECVAVACGADESTCRRGQGTGTQTAQPLLSCTPRLVPTAGQVGFAAVGYRPYGPTTSAGSTYTAPEGLTYRGGCVNEDAESAIAGAYLSYLCPFPEFSLERARADVAYGRHSCYRRPANFLWSGPTPQRATLRWSASDAGVGTLNGVFR